MPNCAANGARCAVRRARSVATNVAPDGEPEKRLGKRVQLPEIRQLITNLKSASAKTVRCPQTPTAILRFLCYGAAEKLLKANKIRGSRAKHLGQFARKYAPKTHQLQKLAQICAVLAIGVELASEAPMRQYMRTMTALETSRQKIVSRLKAEGWQEEHGGERATNGGKFKHHRTLSPGVARQIAKLAGWLE